MKYKDEVLVIVQGYNGMKFIKKGIFLQETKNERYKVCVLQDYQSVLDFKPNNVIANNNESILGKISELEEDIAKYTQEEIEREEKVMKERGVKIAHNRNTMHKMLSTMVDFTKDDIEVLRKHLRNLEECCITKNNGKNYLMSPNEKTNTNGSISLIKELEKYLLEV